MKKFCTNCGQELESDASFCYNCGKRINEKTKSQSEKTTKTNTSSNNSVYAPKSKIAAGLLGIFLGCFGVHNFYLGYNNKAVAQLLITVLSCGILSFASGIWGLIEGILILTGSINEDSEGNPLGE